LVSAFAGKIDLDTDCVLYGEIAYTPIDVWIVNKQNMGPRSVWIMSSVLLLTIIFISLSYKELLISSFDSAFANSLGMRTQIWHYLLVATVSLTTVAAFESVGAILVVALLICPAATAYLLTNKLRVMLVLSSFFGVLTAFFGYYLALVLDGSIAGAMSTVAGILFIFAFIVSKVIKIG
jgi:manganese/zinc/iron transport system permease protein